MCSVTMVSNGYSGGDSFIPHSHCVCACGHLGVGAYGAFALRAGVGADLVEALGAHGLLILLDVFLALQVFAAVEAVKAVGHGGGEVAPGTCAGESQGELPSDATGGQCCTDNAATHRQTRMSESSEMK